MQFCLFFFLCEAEAVPEKGAKHKKKKKKNQEVFVCFKTAHRRITSSGPAGRNRREKTAGLGSEGYRKFHCELCVQ